ncbi:MAG: AI-2E family transporter [Candidatus Acidiferrales bacterium]
MSTEISSQRRLGTMLFYGIVAILAYLVFLVFQPFLPALAWAVVIVVVSYPWYERVRRRFNPTVAALICTLGVTLILIVPTILVMGAFVRQGVQAVQNVQAQVATGHFEWVNRLWMELESKFPDANQANLATILSRYTDQGATFVATKLGTVLRNTASFLFHLSVTMLAMFYLYRDGEVFMERVRALLPFEAQHRDRMIKESHDLIFASVVSSAVAAAAHGILGGLAFGVAGITAPIFWGVMMGFFSLIPLVGSALIWLPASISLISEGHVGAGIALALFCSVVVGLVDNVVRPWVISGRAEMGGLVVFISVLGGIAVFGLLGVIVGPIIVATGASLLDLYVPEARAGNNSGEAAADQNRVVLE